MRWIPTRARSGSVQPVFGIFLPPGGRPFEDFHYGASCVGSCHSKWNKENSSAVSLKGFERSLLYVHRF